MEDGFLALIIYLVLPLVGLLYFIKTNRTMHEDGVVNGPSMEMFIIFATYGGLLLVSLTTIFWKWSGLASLGFFYLILAAPILMTIISVRHRKTRKTSKYHRFVFLSSLLYFAVTPLIIWLLLLIS